MQVHCTLISIIPKHAGRLLALADVELNFDGVVIEIMSVRVEREPNGISVRLPIDRDGRALIVLPEEVRQAMADVVLAGALEVGLVVERATPVG